MNGVKTRGVCRAEQKETRWTFAGWATSTGAENTVRPRAYYRSCGGCTTMVLTLADVDDAQSFVRAIMSDWVRRAGRAVDKIDVENVVGDLFAHLWYLYSKKWVPDFGKGSGTFAGYAANILSKKVNTFVSRDVGDPTGKGRGPKAHSRTLSQSYDGLTGWSHAGGVVEQGSGVGVRGGLEFSFGGVAQDPTGDRVAAGSWLDAPRDSGRGGSFDSGGPAAYSGAS